MSHQHPSERLSEGVDPGLLVWRNRELVHTPRDEAEGSRRCVHVGALGSVLSGGVSVYGSGALSQGGGRASSLFGGSLTHTHTHTHTRTHTHTHTHARTGTAKAPLTWRERRAVFTHRTPNGRDGKTLAWERFSLNAPPSPDRSLDEIVGLQEYQRRLRDDRTRRKEISSQASGGDLNDVLRPLGIDAIGGFEGTRRLVRTVMDLVADVGLTYKDRFARPRPNAVDPTLRPAIGNPPHQAYPSGHSFQFHAVAEVMTRTLPEVGSTHELFFVAQRVAENREYAGVHYPSDSEAGRQLAQWFLPYLTEACRELMLEARREWIG